jgi:N-acyl homoserine lactone hydrolase
MMNNVQQSSDGGHVFVRVTVSGRLARVHAFRCGIVTIKRCHHTGVLPEATPAALRFLAILADRAFADPMPVWAFVVELPGGTVVIDTGADPSYGDPSTWVGHEQSRRLLQSFIKLEALPEDALPAKMAAAGLDPASVQSVILTHQHLDHTGTVPAFPDAEVWTTRAEDDVARLIGSEQWRWRSSDTRVSYVDDRGEPGDLGREVDVHGDGVLIAIHTPGHTPGSVTVRLVVDQGDVWFTGDTSFTAEGMDPDAPTAGIHTDLRAVRRLQSLLAGKGVLLPSHDPGIAVRLNALSGSGMGWHS